jgi:phospho-N-acetylmuramoyl-pentapeptide-transferase
MLVFAYLLPLGSCPMLQLDPLSPAFALPLTGRAALAALVGLGVVLLLGRPVIALLGRFFLEPNYSDSPTLQSLHRKKVTTPTLGGVLLFLSVPSAMLPVVPFSAKWLAPLFLVIGMGTIGAIDDLRKIRTGKKGLSARGKFAALSIVALGTAALLSGDLMAAEEPWGVRVMVLFWIALVLLGSANAVNLTDGLDGLAAGCLVPVFAALAWVGITRGTETAVLAAAMAGALLGYLRFNRYPAQVFLGDLGALPLGGLLGYLAVTLRLEGLLPVFAGVLVVETLSVILQVGRYKLQRKRFFLCAPLHHHFQFLGWPEPTIVRRFATVSVLCAASGLFLASGGSPPWTLLREIQPSAESISQSGASSINESTSAVGPDSASFSREKYPEATARQRQPFSRAQSISRGVSPMMITSEAPNTIPE